MNWFFLHLCVFFVRGSRLGIDGMHRVHDDSSVWRRRSTRKGEVSVQWWKVRSEATETWKVLVSVRGLEQSPVSYDEPGFVPRFQLELVTSVNWFVTFVKRCLELFYYYDVLVNYLVSLFYLMYQKSISIISSTLLNLKRISTSNF